MIKNDNRPQKARISKTHPILLAYAVGNILLLIVNQITNITTSFHASRLASPQYTTQPNAAAAGIVFGILLVSVVFIIELYLVIAKDLAKVKLILKIFLAFQLIALLLVVLRGNILAISIALVEACFTFTTLKYITDKHNSVVL